jgi:hypothetical protein
MDGYGEKSLPWRALFPPLMGVSHVPSIVRVSLLLSPHPAEGFVFRGINLLAFIRGFLLLPLTLYTPILFSFFVFCSRLLCCFAWEVYLGVLVAVLSCGLLSEHYIPGMKL